MTKQNFHIDFNEFQAGTVIDDELKAQGLEVSAYTLGHHPKEAMIFDTANPTGGDHDLETDNLGNVLIISEDGDSSDPDDEAHGGKFLFKFDNPAEVTSLTFLDIEESAKISFFDEHGNCIKSIWVKPGGDNEQVIANFHVGDVSAMVVTLKGSGAIDDLKYAMEPVVALDGIVEGTDGGDRIDVNYLGDPDGDRVDAGDAILPGEAANDDIIKAGDGNDTIISGAGDDQIFGGNGNEEIWAGNDDDLVKGQAGNDWIHGQDGDDTLFGGTGNDMLFGEAGNDELSGGAGHDMLKGGSGNDTMLGGAGNDTLEGNNGHDLIFGDDGHGIASSTQVVTLVSQNGDYDGALIIEIVNADGTVADTVTLTPSYDANIGNSWTVELDADQDLRVSITSPEGTFASDSVNAQGTMISDDTARLNFEDLAGLGDADFNDVVIDVMLSPNGSGLLVEHGVLEAVKGAPGDDLIHAGSGDDTVFGEGGNDTINGDGGNDLLDGEGGMDTLKGGDGNDTIDGGADMDTILGGDGDDSLLGGDGADRVEGGDGNDFIDGGDGDDGFNGKGLFGGDGEDTILGGDGRDVLVGGADNDVLDGEAGNDEMWAGSGDDVLTGGTGNDWMHGQSGNDTLNGGEGSDMLFGEGGNDLLDGGAGADLIKGGDGRDTILGGTHDDEIDGGAGGDDHDTLDLSGVGKFRLEDLRPDSNGNGQDGTVVLLDDDGNEISRFVFTEIETIIGDPEPTPDGYVDGTDGDDLIDVDYDGDPNGDFVDNNDALLPGEAPQDDIIRAGEGDDTVLAGEGDDEIHGGAGDDEIFGEDGNDSIGGNQGNDLIDGGDGDDTLFGQDGNDTLLGGDGNDSLIGGQDGDLLDGGDGNDTIDGFSGDDEILGGDGDDKIVGGGGDDTIDGEGGDDHIAGGNNVDVIDGGAGDDTISAGSRGDTVTGGGGNDSIDGEQGDDLIISGPKGKPDLGYPGLFPGDSDPDNDKDTVDGGSGNDTIFTGDDDDLITGGTGDDVIDGGFDKDTIDAGEGDDRIVGGEGSDSILGGEGDDTIFAGIDPALGLPDNLDIPDDAGDLQPENGKDFVDGGAGNDVIFGQDDDDTLEGGEGDDFINGGVDDDVIRGGAGDDTIEGGEGEDNLSGGADQDTFQADDDGAGSFIGDTVDGGAGGVDHDTLDLRGTVTDGGRLAVTETGPDSNGNGVNGFVEYFDGDDNLLGTLEFTEIEKVIVCFTPGTTIATPKGEVAVETLRPGDKVMTRDNGIQEIAWTGARDLSAAEMAAAQELRPVLIKAGSLGPNLPERDMMVSPQHRVLLANDRTQLYFEEREVLVAAKHLVGMEGITRAGNVDTTYVHFMCEKHEVVLSDGAWTETFQPGDYTLAGMDGAARQEILALFPELATHDGLKDYVSARKALKRHEASLLVAR